MAECHYVVVDGERYSVPDGAADAVSQEILAAVHAGGAYVSLGRPGIGYTDVLVTSTTPVRIEHVTSRDASLMSADATDHTDDIDPSWWL